MANTVASLELPLHALAQASRHQNYVELASAAVKTNQILHAHKMPVESAR